LDNNKQIPRLALRTNTRVRPHTHKARPCTIACSIHARYKQGKGTRKQDQDTQSVLCQPVGLQNKQHGKACATRGKARHSEGGISRKHTGNVTWCVASAVACLLQRCQPPVVPPICERHVLASARTDPKMHTPAKPRSSYPLSIPSAPRSFFC